MNDNEKGQCLSALQFLDQYSKRSEMTFNEHVHSQQCVALIKSYIETKKEPEAKPEAPTDATA